MHTLLALLAACAPEDHQSEIDALVVYGVLDTEIFLYDQNVIGTPVGPVDLTADCPLGGTVDIVGESNATADATIDLVLTFVECGATGSGYGLTFDGDVAWSGSFRSTGYKALASSSDGLGVAGTVYVGDEWIDVDEDCALGVTDRGEDGQTSSVSGEWCGRSVAF